MVDVSIVIVNYKSWNAMVEGLNVLSSIESSRFVMEIIVVDNNSNDNQIITFRESYPKIQFIENSGNNGFANGCNTGANAAKGEFLFFLNPDTVASENAIYELWQTAKINPEFGIITCTQVDDNGRNYKEIRFFPSLKTLFGPFRAMHKLANKDKISSNFSSDKNIVFPDWATGAVIFMSKDWFKKINGWSENYWLYFEDVDICKKVAQSNGKVALIRNVSILHKHGGASRINIKTKALTKTEVLISQHVYFNLHYKGFEQFLIQFLLIISLLIEKILLLILGLLFFFVSKLKVNVLIFKNLFTFYFSAFANATWTSPRATIYKRKP